MKFLMRSAVSGAVLAGVSLAVLAPAHAEDVKVGIIAAFSGSYSTWGQEFQRGLDLYMAEHNGKDGNPTVTLVTRDDGGDNPARTKQLAQELIVREGVVALAGEEFTTNVLAVSDVITQAKVPFVIFNAATGFITDKSPYFIRPAFTLWTNSWPDGKWAAAQKMKRIIIVAADYAPGTDATNAFTKGFSDGGGQIVEVIRPPLGTTDFSSYLQRVKDANVQGMYMFMPNGPMSVGLLKQFADSGLGKTVQLLAAAETEERDLKVAGDAAVGVVTAMPYGPYLDNPKNKAFVAAYQAKYTVMPSFMTVMAYDGLDVVFKMLRATGGKPDMGDQMMAAIKGYAFQSPRGPVSIDADTREATQNMYMRRVEKMADGTLYNKEFFTYPNVKELWHEMNPKK